MLRSRQLLVAVAGRRCDRGRAARCGGGDSIRGRSADPLRTGGRGDEQGLTRQWWEAKAQCHTDHGFPAHWDGEGIVTDVGPDQRADYQKMTALCQEEVEQQLGPNPQAIPYSAEELGAMYELLVTETVPCLEAEGITVEQPQSKETWVEQQTKMYLDPGPPDTAWDSFRELDPNLAMGMADRCPRPTGADITRWLEDHGR